MTKRIQFVHIPKCAGTSVWNLINSLIDQPENRIKPHHSPVKAVEEGSFTFTILREPMKRLISYYQFVSVRKFHHINERNPNMVNATLFDFVTYLLEIHNHEISNIMTKFLAGRISHDVSYEEALHNVSSNAFNHIGFTEELEHTQSTIIEYFGKSQYTNDYISSQKKLQKSNKISISSQKHCDKAFELLIQSNQEDLKLYSYIQAARRNGLFSGLF